MANGIIIDVGFKADIQKFVDDLNRQLGDVDYDKAVGLDKAFAKQEKEVKTRLKNLKTAIDEVINGTSTSEPAQQMKELKASVNELGRAFKAMQDSMPKAQQERFSRNFAEMSNTTKELTSVVTNATDAISDLSKTTDKMSFGNDAEFEKTKNSFRELRGLIGELSESKEKFEKMDSDDFVDDMDKYDENLSKIEEHYKELLAARDRFQDATDSGDTSSIKETAKEFGEQILQMSKYLQDFSHYNGDFKEEIGTIGSGKFEVPIDVAYIRDEISDSFDEVKNALSSEMDSLDDFAQKNFANILGGKSLGEYLTKAVKKEVPDFDGANLENLSSLKIPIDISTRGDGLATDAKKIIAQAQSRLKDTDLQIGISLMSDWGTRKTRELVKKMSESVDTIYDPTSTDKGVQKARENLNAFVNEANKRINDALLFNVEVNSNKAENEVKEFVRQSKDLMDELSESFVLYPRIQLEDDAKTKIQSQLDTMVGDQFAIDLSIVDGKDDGEETKYLNTLKRKVNDISNSVVALKGAFEGVGNIVIPAFSEYAQQNLQNVRNSIYIIHQELEKTIAAIKTVSNNGSSTVPQTDFSTNSENIEGLKNSAQRIKNAVKTANEGFVNLQSVLSSTIADDVSKLDKLYDSLDEIDGQVSSIISSFKEMPDSIKTKIDIQFMNGVGKQGDQTLRVIKNLKENLETLSDINVDNISQLSKGISELSNSGSNGSDTASLLNQLNTTIKQLGNDKSSEKINTLCDNLERLKDTVSQLNLSDSGFVSQLNEILNKKEQLKSLSEILKSTKSQIDSVSKTVAGNEAYNNASKYLQANEDSIRNNVSKTISENSPNSTILYQNLSATKDGLVQVSALVKDVTGEYKKYTYAIGENQELQLRNSQTDQAKLLKEKENWEKYEKLKNSVIPGAKNLGKEGETFTPNSEGWEALKEKAAEFGIKMEDVQKIIRNVDELGHESFQIFTKLSRITIGVDSKGVLFQTDEVLDLAGTVNTLKKNIDKANASMKSGFKGDEISVRKVEDALTEVVEQLGVISTYENSKDILKSDGIFKYLSAFKNNIQTFSVEKLDEIFKYKPRTEEVMKDYNDLKSLAEKISGIKIENFSPEDVKLIQEYTDRMRQLFASAGKKENTFADIGSIQKELTKLSKAMNNNGAMAKDLKQKYRELRAEMESYGDKMPTDVYIQLTQRAKRLNAELERSGKVGRSFFEMFTGGIVRRTAGTLAQYLSLYDIIRYVRQLADTVKEVNTAQIELRKVSDASDNELKRYWSDATASAKEYGATISEVINTASDWSRLGYSLSEAKELTDATVLLQKVGDNMSRESASEGIISTLKGFGKEADEVQHVIDVANQVANTEPIDTSELFEGLQKSASSLKAAGNTYEQGVALLSSANSVVQDASISGNALKTITMRIRAAKTELESAGEDTEGMAESTAKLRKEILALSGVDIMKNDTQFKSTYDILDELSTKWQDLTDIQQASITELIAGKRNGNIVSALMSNFDIARKSLDTGLNGSEGSAQRELENYQKGVQYSLDNIKASFQEFATDVLDSDSLKSFIDLGTKLLNLLDGFVKVTGKLSIPIAGAGIFGVIKGLSKGETGERNFVESMRRLQGLGENVSKGTGILNALDLSQGEDSVAKISEALEGYDSKTKVAIISTSNLSKAVKEAAIKEVELSVATKTSSSSMSKFTSVAKGMKVELASMAAGLAKAFAFTAIVAGVSFAIKKVHEFANETETVKGKASDFANSASKSINEFATNSESLSSLNDEYKELSKGVNDLGQNVSLTQSEYTKYKEVIGKVSDAMPNLTALFDAQGNKIGFAKGKLADLNDEYSKYKQQSAANLLKNGDENGNTLSDIVKAREKVNKLNFVEGDLLGKRSDTEYQKQLDDLSKYSKKQLLNVLKAEDGLGGKTSVLKKLGITKDSIQKDFNGVRQTLKEEIKSVQTDIENTQANTNTALVNIAYSNTDFKKLGQDAQDNLVSMLQKLDAKTFDSLDIHTEEEYKRYVAGLIQTMDKDSSVSKAWTELFKLDDSDLDPIEAAEKIKTYLNKIMNALGIEGKKNRKNFMKGLGLDPDTLTRDYNKVIKGMNADDKNTIRDYFKNNSINTTEEVDAFYDATKSVEGATEKIKKFEEANNKAGESIKSVEDIATAYDNINKQIDSIQSEYNALTSAVDEYNSQGYLSLDTLQGIISLDNEHLACLETKNGQLALNTNAMAALAEAQLDSAEATAVDQAMQELSNVTREDSVSATEVNIKGNDALMKSLSALSGSYDALQGSAAAAAQAQALSSMIDEKNAINPEKTKKIIAGLNAKIGLINTTRKQIRSGNFGKVAKSGSSSKGSSKDTAKDEVDKFMKYQAALLDGGKITYKNYTDTVQGYLDNMYRHGKISAEEYFRFIKTKLEKQKSFYDAVLNAITTRIDDEVKRIQELIDNLTKANERLNKDKDNKDKILSAVNKVYDDEIKRLQEILDNLDKANERREKALALEKAKYELRKAEESRSQKIYVEGKGYVYDVDHDAVRDARENVANAELELTKLKLNEQIEALQKAQEEWQKVSSAYTEIENDLAAKMYFGANYQAIILQNRASDVEDFKNKYVAAEKQIHDNQELIDSYNEKVEYYNKLKEQWNDVSSQYEKEMNRLYAAQVLGANWVTKLLQQI